VSAQERVTIKIPKVLYKRIAEIIEGTGFSSVTDFIVYVLRDIVSARSVEAAESLTKDEVDAVKSKLKSLGYM